MRCNQFFCLLMLLYLPIVLAQPSLNITKTDSLDPIPKGTTLSYQITINNTGNETAFNVTVIDTYPAEVVFNGSSPAPSLGNDTFDIGDLAPNASTTINITVNVSAALANGTIITNDVNATYNSTNGTTYSNATSETTTIIGFPVISTSKTDSPDPVPRGTTLTYQILVNNTGDYTAVNVTLVEGYPAGVTFNGSQPSPAAGNNTFDLGDLSPNESILINITVNVSSTLSNGTILNNTYNVTFLNSTGFNATTTNNSLTSVLGAPNITVIKTESSDPAISGAQLNYTIVVNNTGDDTAYNVTVVETYPINVTFNTSTPSPTGGNTIFSVGNLSPNQSTTVNITVIVNANATGVLNNTVTVIFANSSGQNASVNTSITTNVSDDSDGDGVPDTNDTLIGGPSNVTTSGVTNLNITVGGNSTNGTFSGTQIVTFLDGATALMNFTFNFDNNSLNLSGIRITVTASGIAVNVSGQVTNKTLFLSDTGFTTLCVKDAEIASVGDITAGCNGVNETVFTSCLGGNATSGNITCIDTGSVIVISGLVHSGVSGGAASSSSTGGGGGGGRSYRNMAVCPSFCQDPDYSNLISCRNCDVSETVVCLENWSCTPWDSCINGTQIRTCTDTNTCGSISNKPATLQTCTRPSEQEDTTKLGENIDAVEESSPFYESPLAQRVKPELQKPTNTSTLTLWTFFGLAGAGLIGLVIWYFLTK